MFFLLGPRALYEPVSQQIEKIAGESNIVHTYTVDIQICIHVEVLESITNPSWKVALDIKHPLNGTRRDQAIATLNPPPPHT